MKQDLATVKLVTSRLTKVYDCQAFYPAEIPGGYPSAIVCIPSPEYVVDEISRHDFVCCLLVRPEPPTRACSVGLHVLGFWVLPTTFAI